MVVVVGGHTRNIGKTSVAAGIIARLPEFAWTALKITQFGHGVCSHGGHHCACGDDVEHPYVLSEEYEPGTSDSARFLAAGARRSFWLRTAAGELRRALPVLNRLMNEGGNLIIESNSVMELVRPALYLVVLDPARKDFKDTALRYLDRADAFITAEGVAPAAHGAVPLALWESKPRFTARPPDYISDALVELIRRAA
jgi:hypothetical protein